MICQRCNKEFDHEYLKSHCPECNHILWKEHAAEHEEDYAKMEKSIADIVREYFPDATEEFCEFVLWEKTGYPSFWNIPKDGNTPEECLRKQLVNFRDATATES